jgi:hypothetical protein
MRTILLTTAVLLTATLAASAQCGSCGSCSGCSSCILQAPDEPAAFGFRDLHWVWSTDPTDVQRVYLFRGAIQIGGWDYQQQYYRPYHAHLDWWGPPRRNPPIDPPPQAKPAAREDSPAPKSAPPVQPAQPVFEQWQTHGVDTTRIDGSRENSYSINGIPVSPQRALHELKLDDDSAKLWLVLIGSADNRGKLLADLQAEPKMKDLQNHARLWSVAPDHFSLYDRDTNRPMFSVKSDPTIYLLAPDGQVLFEQRGRAAGDLEALRKADPSYTPDAPPKPAPAPALPGDGIPLWPILVGGSVLSLLALKRKQ